MINTSSQMACCLTWPSHCWKTCWVFRSWRLHATLSLICSESARYYRYKVFTWIGEMNKWNALHKIPNGRGGMVQPPTVLVDLQTKAAMKEAQININRICPNTVPNLPPGTHAYDPESNNFIERVAKVDISSVHASNDSGGPRIFEQYSV